jgi:hypothetical protein
LFRTRSQSFDVVASRVLPHAWDEQRPPSSLYPSQCSGFPVASAHLSTLPAGYSW